MSQRRRTLTAVGLIFASAAAITAYVLSNNSGAREAAGKPRAKQAPGTKEWGQIAIVVSALDNYQNLLDSHPSLMLVGTRATKLRGNVKKGDEYRVIETETENGWEHIVKHLRPDTVILSQGLTGDNIGAFTRRVLQMEDAYELQPGRDLALKA